MFVKKRIKICERDAIAAVGLGNYSLSDTFECGQCFRFVKLSPNEEGRVNSVGKEYKEYVEYMTVVRGKLIFVGQRSADELLFYNVSDKEFDEICVPYFALDTDYDAIKNDILAHTDSEFLKQAAEAASGIRILRQEPWETLFSFIISQNNNIPRIKKIIRNIASNYGDNLAVSEKLTFCPAAGEGAAVDGEKCRECGICYSFPEAERIISDPDKLLLSHPGFRFKYLLDATEKVISGEINFDEIIKKSSYVYTMEELMKVKGVGEKVASCTSLFAFSNLEAFPIDVWMKRAIDEYFGGKLDHEALGAYAGVAQQYIFHYIRMLNS